MEAEVSFKFEDTPPVNTRFATAKDTILLPGNPYKVNVPLDITEGQWRAFEVGALRSEIRIAITHVGASGRIEPGMVIQGFLYCGGPVAASFEYEVIKLVPGNGNYPLQS